jgi:hypothetical protein
VWVCGRVDAHAVKQGEVRRRIDLKRGLQVGELEHLLPRDASSAPTLCQQEPTVGGAVHGGALPPARRAEENGGLRQVFQGAPRGKLDEERLFGRDVSGGMHLGRRGGGQAHLRPRLHDDVHIQSIATQHAARGGEEEDIGATIIFDIEGANDAGG